MIELSGKIENNMIFVLSNERSPEDADLLHLEWAVVSQLDGQKTVGQIAENLALSRTEIEEIFRKLSSQNLLVLVNRSGRDSLVSPEFFKILNHEMTLLLGPVAGIILEDVLEMMRMNRDNFEVQNLPVLIELLTNQIDDPVKQVEFQKNIYNRVRVYLFK
ncbi:MAG: hypothetical protein A2Y94_08745 [Caldithrix sp. RBG_13_44_9]|nr:MAG: hypothetical protein A2Y94_08745 [Caldithrix sp. RBG_13_44_9]